MLSLLRLECRDSASLQPRQVAQILFQRPRGAAPEDLAGASHLFAAQDAGSAAEDDACAYGCVFSNPDLAAEDGSVFDHARAGDAGLRCDDDVLADDAVVADVDEVVDLRAAADAGLAECAAVDGGVGADLDVVFDDEAALLREDEVLAGLAVLRA